MYLIGIDIGTSSTKSCLFDEKGTLVASGSIPHLFDVLHPGYAEQDPEVWWNAVCQSVRAALKSADINKEEIAAIGLSGQMHGLVPLNKQGEVIRKAILHCDVRAGKEAEEINHLCPQKYESITYNPTFPGFQAVSLYWMKKHEPDLFQQIDVALCPKDYIRYRMTGMIGTEHTDASGTLLYDAIKQDWSPELFRILGISSDIVPHGIHSSYEIAGTLCSEAADEMGLDSKTLVVYGGADQAMQSTGNGIYRTGTMMATIGTSGQVFYLTDRPVFNKELNSHTFRHVENGRWYSLGAVLYAGSALNWFRAKFCPEKSFEDMSVLADEVNPGCEGLLFFPCMGGERTPYMDPDTRGIFLGVSAAHGMQHFIRSIMEGVAFAVKDSINIISDLYTSPETLICAGGGVKGSVWAHIQADVYDKPILISRIKEQACLGAAIMAAIGSNIYPTLGDACDNMCDQNMTVIYPNSENVKIYKSYYEDVYKSIYSSNQELFQRINHMQEGGYGNI